MQKKEASSLYKVSLYPEQLAKLHHDKSLEHLYPANNGAVQKKMTREEFDDFLKTNDLIVYRHHLKSYQEGIVCGEFSEV